MIRESDLPTKGLRNILSILNNKSKHFIDMIDKNQLEDEEIENLLTAVKKLPEIFIADID